MFVDHHRTGTRCDSAGRGMNRHQRVALRRPGAAPQRWSGRESRTELPTPALVLDLELLRGNIATMAAWALGHAAIRPHFKVHKCLEIARGADPVLARSE